MLRSSTSSHSEPSWSAQGALSRFYELLGTTPSSRRDSRTKLSRTHGCGLVAACDGVRGEPPSPARVAYRPMRGAATSSVPPAGVPYLILLAFFVARAPPRSSADVLPGHRVRISRLMGHCAPLLASRSSSLHGRRLQLRVRRHRVRRARAIRDTTVLVRRFFPISSMRRPRDYVLVS